jgi:hypothetical protein
MPTTNENKDIICGPSSPMHAYTMKIISALVEYAKIMNMKRIQIINQRPSNKCHIKLTQGWASITMPLALVGHHQ